MTTPCSMCGAACRFVSTSLPALAELADLGDALALAHLNVAAARPAPGMWGALAPFKSPPARPALEARAS